MSKSKSLIFFGTEAFSLSALVALIGNGFDVVAVVTKPDSTRGRSKDLQPSAVKQYALEKNLPVIQHPAAEDIENDLKQYNAFGAVLSSFGKIIPTSILNMFEGGIVNVHPSLLPNYRGASPIEQAILNGDEFTGVSIMKLVEKMDAGPVYAQQTLKLSGDETSTELYESLAKVGSELLTEVLPSVMSGELEPKSQDESQATFAPIISKRDGRIDWKKPAAEIERQVRAYKGWPGSKTILGDTEITIIRASIVDENGPAGSSVERTDDIVIYCDEKALAIHELRPAGKRSMTAREFLAGNKLYN